MSCRLKRRCGTGGSYLGLWIVAARLLNADAFSFALPRNLPNLLDISSAVLSAPTSSEQQDANIFSLCDEDESADETTQTSAVNNNSTVFPRSDNQQRSIQSSSPAVLLSSGPGTGKTHTLASRVAYLLQTEACPPERMVIMSFSNRDAEVLKSKAVDQALAQPLNESSPKLSRKQLVERLWSGTIHKFASNIIRAYSSKNRAVRVISDREVKVRIDRCLRQLLNDNQYNGPNGAEKLKQARLLHRDALVELRQSRSVMIHQVGRCIELWKESSMLPPPSVHGIAVSKESYQVSSQQTRENCLELATRLGIARNVAFLAWAIFPMYQDLHERQSTGDPADLVPLAYHLLLSRPQQLRKLRTKLKHVILDEYQDVSVSQHSLIRLVIRGVVNELNNTEQVSQSSKLNVPPVLAAPWNRKKVAIAPLFDVPRLFCAGDAHQSIYGFRGAAPQLSVDGFQDDFPQGVVAHLDTSFRLAEKIWSSANLLIPDDGQSSFIDTFQKSPVGAARARTTMFEVLNQCTSQNDVESLTEMLAEDMSDDLTGSIHVQGVWDAREEAKHIAMQIKRRAKDRTKSFAAATTAMSEFVDPSEIAIVVRATNQLNLVKEMLEQVGVPYVDLNGQAKLPPTNRSAASMKPVVLMTMHGSKGEEFDEVYLPGWTEGVFPHPSAVSSNRVDEERRLAYVAISRARHRVFVTHAYIRRALHNGPNLKHKKVTMQVRPSRFLYELVPNGVYSVNDVVNNSEAPEHSQDETHLPTITWDRSRGSKGGIAGTNLPEYFQKSYQTPKHFTAPEHPDQELLIMQRQLELIKQKPAKKARSAISSPKKVQKSLRQKRRSRTLAEQNAPISLTPTNLIGDETALVLQGLNEILARKWGSSTKYKKIFQSLLKERFGLAKGRINLFDFEKEAKALPNLTKASFDTMLSATSTENFSSRPLSHGTALQLGLFLMYSLSGSESTKTSN